MPTYNRPDFLAEAVASVMAQTITDFECIIVDDASPTPVAPPEDPRFRVMRHTENGGHLASLNTGLAAATGTYVAFLDDDDMYMPDRLEIALEGLSKADLSVCWRENFGAGSKARIITDTWNGDLAHTIRDRAGPQIGTIAVARSRALPFCAELKGAGDGEWLLRMAQGRSFYTVTRVGLRYREHDTLRRTNFKSMRADMLVKIHGIHKGYFDTHPKAAAFLFRKIGLNAMSNGRVGMAFRAFGRSFLMRPNPGILLTAVNALVKYLLNRSRYTS